MKVKERISFRLYHTGAEPHAFFVTFSLENVTFYDLFLSVSFP